MSINVKHTVRHTMINAKLYQVISWYKSIAAQFMLLFDKMFISLLLPWGRSVVFGWWSVEVRRHLQWPWPWLLMINIHQSTVRILDCQGLRSENTQKKNDKIRYRRQELFLHFSHQIIQWAEWSVNFIVT